MGTVIMLQLDEVGVSGLVVGGQLGRVGGVSELGGSSLVLLVDDDGDSSLPGFTVHELQQIEVVGGHR
jgi:hypothetical protein